MTDSFEEITVSRAKTKYAGGGYIEDEFILFDEMSNVPMPKGFVRFQSVLFAVCTKGSAA